MSLIIKIGFYKRNKKFKRWDRPSLAVNKIRNNFVVLEK